MSATTQGISRRSRGRDDGYTVGQVLHCPRIKGGGGADGHYWTVVRQMRKWRDDDTDDWMVGATIRPATDAECAPLAARILARAAREQLQQDLERIRGERLQIDMPPDAAVLIPCDPSRLCATGTRVAIVDGVILHQRVGDPDMCDSLYYYVVRLAEAPAELAARVAAHIATARGEGAR